MPAVLTPPPTIGYVVDVYFCVFDVSVEEFGAGFGFGLGIGFRLGIGIGIRIALVDVGYLDIANTNTKTTISKRTGEWCYG
jgi:hypothetical protein